MKTRMTLTEKMALKKQQESATSTQTKLNMARSLPDENQSEILSVRSTIENQIALQGRQPLATSSMESSLNGGIQNPQSERKSAFLEPSKISSITFSNLRVAPYEVVRLLDVKTTQGINEHGTLYFKALLSEEQQDRYVELNTEGQNVELSVADSSGHGYILFQGIVKNVKVSAQQEMFYLEVEAISYSHLLDLQPKSRSFQNLSMTYQEVFETVTDDHPNAGVIDNTSDGKIIDKLIVQHKETDYEFATRLASHFNVGLICDVRFDSPKYYVGLPPSPVLTLEHFNYSVQKDVKRFRELSKNGVEGLQENDFISYEIKTDHILQVGSQVNFRNKSLYVFSIEGRVDQGIFMNHCILMPKNGLKQKYIEHDKVVGCSFSGKIIDIKNDLVKVHMDIDPEQDVATACFFPYSTIYSSEDGSGWYCMPELSDSVKIYCPNGDEGHAYAISSVHQPVSATLPTSAHSGASMASNQQSGGASGGSGVPPSGGMMRDDPDIKSLRSPCGKTIELSPDGILIDIGSSQITLTPDDGIVMQSEKDIVFNAEKNINITAEEEIKIVGTDCVEISAGDLAYVKIDDNVEIVGYEVKSN